MWQVLPMGILWRPWPTAMHVGSRACGRWWMALPGALPRALLAHPTPCPCDAAGAPVAAQGHTAGGAGVGPNGPGAPWLGDRASHLPPCLPNAAVGAGGCCPGPHGRCGAWAQWAWCTLARGPDFVAGVANGHIVAPMPHSQPMHVGPCVAGGGRQGGRGGGWQCPVQPRAPPAHPTPCPMPSAPLSNARPNGGCAQGGGLPLAAPVAVPGWRLAAPVAAGWWRVAVGGCESKSTHTCGHRPTMVYRHA